MLKKSQGISRVFCTVAAGMEGDAASVASMDTFPQIAIELANIHMHFRIFEAIFCKSLPCLWGCHPVPLKTVNFWIGQLRDWWVYSQAP